MFANKNGKTVLTVFAVEFELRKRGANLFFDWLPVCGNEIEPRKCPPSTGVASKIFQAVFLKKFWSTLDGGQVETDGR